MFLSVSFLLSSIFRSIPTIPTARILPAYATKMEGKIQVVSDTSSLIKLVRPFQISLKHSLNRSAELLSDNAAFQWSKTLTTQQLLTYSNIITPEAQNPLRGDRLT